MLRAAIIKFLSVPLPVISGRKGRSRVKSTGKIPWKYDMNSLVGDIRDDPKKARLVKDLLKTMDEVFGHGSEEDESADESDYR